MNPIAVYKTPQIPPSVVKVAVALLVSYELWHLVRDLMQKEYAWAGFDLVRAVVYGIVAYVAWLSMGQEFELTQQEFVRIDKRGRHARPLSEIANILFARDGGSYRIEFRDGTSAKFPLAARNFVDAVAQTSRVPVVAA